MNKESLRKEVILKRDNITLEDRTIKSKLIISKLEGLSEFIQAKKVLSYYSYGSEVKIVDAMEKWAKQKELYLPKLNKDLSFKALPYDELVKNRYGIPEPISGEGTKDLDLIIIPGTAFDKKGGRLGMGKGYYDRFLSKHKDVLRIGLAFDEQILESVPQKPYDEIVDIIITDKEIIRR